MPDHFHGVNAPLCGKNVFPLLSALYPERPGGKDQGARYGQPHGVQVLGAPVPGARGGPDAQAVKDRHSEKPSGRCQQIFRRVSEKFLQDPAIAGSVSPPRKAGKSMRQKWCM